MSPPAWPVVPAGVTFDPAWEPVVFSVPAPAPYPPGFKPCHVYWGSHGCGRERGHEGDCDCGCCTCDHHPYPDWPDTHVLCVAKAPYYGPETRFYGEDVAARGLPEVDGP